MLFLRIPPLPPFRKGGMGGSESYFLKFLLTLPLSPAPVCRQAGGEEWGEEERG
jgi:hypothetical protein